MKNLNFEPVYYGIMSHFIQVKIYTSEDLKLHAKSVLGFKSLLVSYMKN